MKFDKSIGDMILDALNASEIKNFELPGNDVLMLVGGGFIIHHQEVNCMVEYCGSDIIKVVNGLRFVLDDGTTRTYIYSNED